MLLWLEQVLDDSSDPECQKLIEEECARWAARGVPIKYRHRVDRKGYKVRPSLGEKGCCSPEFSAAQERMRRRPSQLPSPSKALAAF